MIYEFKDIVHKHGESGRVELEADVVIVGTGAGGAPLAYELANEGYSVIMLEEGGYHTTGDFRFNANWTTNHLYRDAGLLATVGIPIVMAPVGQTVGGTTTINQGTSLRLPRSQLKRWHAEHGLIEIDYDELSLIYSAIEEFLFIKKADPEVSGNNAKKFLEGAKKLGLTGDYLPRNAKDCEGYGVCSFGCPSGAKQSMEKSYIPAAVNQGADVYADCRVEDVLLENGKAVGFAGHFRDHDTHETGPEVMVYGKVSVLAAGTIGTPMLLFRNGLCNSSGQVGRNYHNHPAIQTVPVYDEVINAHDGISESVWVKDFEEYGIVIETTFLSPEMMAAAVPGACRKHSGAMLEYSNMGLFGGMLRDTTSGKVIPLDRKGRKFIILYQLNKKDIYNTKLSTVVMAEIAIAAGAKKVFTYISGHEVIESLKDVERLKRAKISRKHIITMAGSHSMGTCRMGADPETSVVGTTHETWDVPDLYIVDASVFPSALGVNPQLTVMAFSIRATGFINDRLVEKGIKPGRKHKENASGEPAIKESA